MTAARDPSAEIVAPRASSTRGDTPNLAVGRDEPQPTVAAGDESSPVVREGRVVRRDSGREAAHHLARYRIGSDELTTHGHSYELLPL